MTSLALVMSMMTSLGRMIPMTPLGRMSQAEVRVESPLSISTPSTVRLMPGRVPRSSGWYRSLVRLLVLVDLAVNHGGGVGVPLTDYKTVQPYTTTTYGLIATVLPQLSTVSATTTVTVHPDPVATRGLGARLPPCPHPSPGYP